MNETQKKKIIFVCTGNTCRSPMAEAICRSELKRLRADGVEALSAGTEASFNGRLNPYSAITLAENGLALENFTSTLLTDELLEDAYAVVCMTESQRERLIERRAFAFFQSVGKNGSLGENIHSFYSLAGYEIPDPFGRDLDCYRITFARIIKAMPIILEKLGVKSQQVITPAQEEQNVQAAPSGIDESAKTEPVKKKRGRPRKNPQTPTSEVAPKKRGRPKKNS
ncbi:MAG: hypothetical protein IKA72_05285 [Clostridia bacterium]|nr:hypothetical protein [Clostridia bacterium]